MKLCNRVMQPMLKIAEIKKQQQIDELKWEMKKIPKIRTYLHEKIAKWNKK